MSDDDALSDSKAPLIEHLAELRKRLIYCIIGILIGFAACYVVADYLFAFLSQPLLDAFEGQEGKRMIFTGIHEAFVTKLKVSFFAAICVAFPIIAIQIWKFVAPGLYAKEQKAFAPFLIATPVLFILGGALAYYFIIPQAFVFLLSFEDLGQVGALADGALAVESEPRVAEYLSFIMVILFAFGACFQLPVLLILLARVGIVTAEGLKARRKYAVVVVFAVAAFITPPDVISQIGLGIPVLLLYEASIIIIQFMDKRRKAADEASETG